MGGGKIGYLPDIMWPSILALDGGSGNTGMFCFYSRQGFKQLLMSTVAHSDFLSCCGSHCIEYSNFPPFLEYLA
jgi:hypothetical protein